MLKFAGIGVALIVGCVALAGDGPEATVRAQFAHLQAAIKAGSGEKLLALLNDKSRADVDREVKAIQTAHAKPNLKAKVEELVGLKDAAVTGLKATDLPKLKHFHKKYHELPESKIEKVVISGENATVHYIEPDDDHEKILFTRQGGEWKIWLAIPKMKAE